MTKLTPPLKWLVGKHYLAKRIIELMPAHLHYVEPYFGGGASQAHRRKRSAESRQARPTSVCGRSTRA